MHACWQASVECVVLLFCAFLGVAHFSCSFSSNPRGQAKGLLMQDYVQNWRMEGIQFLAYTSMELCAAAESEDFHALRCSQIGGGCSRCWLAWRLRFMLEIFHARSQAWLLKMCSRHTFILCIAMMFCFPTLCHLSEVQSVATSYFVEHKLLAFWGLHFFSP